MIEKNKSKKSEDITIQFANGKTESVQKGKSISDIIEEKGYQFNYKPVVAKVNNKLAGLGAQLYKDSKVELLDLTARDGRFCYHRSLSFLLIIAVQEIFGKDADIEIKHSLCKGFFCEIHLPDGRILTHKDVIQIEEKMNEWVEKDIPFRRHETDIKSAIEIFKAMGHHEKVKLLEYRISRGDKKVSVYECGGYQNHFYGYLVPSTGYLKVFELRSYPPGLLLRFPRDSYPDILPEMIEQVKLFSVYKEYGDWGKILGVRTVADLNEKIVSKNIDELILVAEALHEKKIAEIADLIKTKIIQPKLILISGPSSSGKTTFSKRLDVQLRVNGFNPITISLDNYFVDRDNTPRDEWGEFDFEAIEALDAKLFTENILALLDGDEVVMPRYDFKTGSRKAGKNLKIDKDQVIIVEGIHGLNRRLTEQIPDSIKFKIYVSPLTMLNLDKYNRIPTTDTRLIRRMVRDHFYRGYSALGTLKRWSSVNKGEDKYIYPYQERAEVMFNSSLVYELSVLKKFASPLLKKISSKHSEFGEAARILKFLSHFMEINPHNIPKASILREFIGGSAFNY